MNCLCSGRSNKVDHFLAETLATPPDIQDDDHLSKRIFQRISTVVSPREVARDSSYLVNVDATTSSHATPSVRRMSSLRLPLPSNDGYRFSQGGGRLSQDGATGPHLMWTESRQVLEVEIQAAKAQSHQSWQPDLASDESRLQARLEKLKLDMQVVQGDGNCQFRSVSQALWGTQDYHMNVRQKAVGHMRDHKEEYDAFLGEGIDSYLNSMATNCTWGDELTLRAICDSYGIIVNVLTSDQHNWFMRYKPREMLLLKEVFLTYISPVHYNAIRRRRAQQVLQRRLSLGRQSSQIQAALDRAREEQKTIARISEGADALETVKQNGHAIPVL